MDPSKCVILMPVGGRIEPQTDDALRALAGRGYAVRRVHGYSAIDQARNQIATDALRDGFAELMWIDSDVLFRPADVDKLRAHDLPFCCAIYPKKGKRAFAFNFKPEQRAVKFGRGGGLLELDRAGFGFTYTRAEVYERVREHHGLPECNRRYDEHGMVPYFQPMIVTDGEHHDYLAEDFAFCERAKAAGIPIMADTSIRLFHVGTYPYGWEDAGRGVERFGDYTFNVW
jgi:hypothetical protein